jgi:hypothetical protein
MKKYQEHSGRKLDREAERAWYIQCRENQIPFVVVKSRTALADVHWDYFSYSNELDKKIRGRSKEICQFAEDLFLEYRVNSARKATRSICANVISIKNLAISDARAAAERLYDFLGGILKRPA